MLSNKFSILVNKKMKEEFLNQVVFSTRFVIKENSPIQVVFHDEDGTWQFFGPEKKVETEDGMILFMKEVIEIDPTIIDALGVSEGYEARRHAKGSPWIILKTKP
jgi:hypothetical protein